MSRASDPSIESAGKASLDAWATLEIDDADGAPIAAPKRVIVGRMQELMREERAHRSNRRRWALAAVVAAAICLLAGGALALRSTLTRSSAVSPSVRSFVALEKDGRGFRSPFGSHGQEAPSVVSPVPSVEAAASASSSPTVAPLPRSSAPPAVSTVAPDRPLSASDLAEQNRLFQAASTARRTGDDRKAIALYDELLTRYPSSPLAAEARTEKNRAAARLGTGP